MAIKDRKNRRMRGTRTCGKGKRGSRRSSGGKGMAGSQKHKYTWIVKYAPDWFGNTGMPRETIRPKPKSVNVDYLSQYAEKHKLKEVDATELGFEKVLGGGKITNAITIEAKTFTKKAIEKIKEAGGKAVEK
ncbi:MAG: uL15 family ribosomal protein [Candidatus Diapherotrites archaeon]|nr:uL15 family ribosomal protein [Candidatus Diapherotrites archaeon]